MTSTLGALCPVPLAQGLRVRGRKKINKKTLKQIPEEVESESDE
jgi:hypothetical protein